MASRVENGSSGERRLRAVLGVLVAIGMVAGLALSVGNPVHVALGDGSHSLSVTDEPAHSALEAPRAQESPHAAESSGFEVTFKEGGLPFGSRWSVSAGLAGSIPTGDLPLYDAVDSANGNVYVSDSNSSDVRVLNGASDQLVTAIPTLPEPSGIAFDSRNGELYVADSNSSNVTVINGTTDAVQTVIPIGAPSASGIGFDVDTGDLYVAMNATNSVAVINGATNTVVIDSIRVGSDPLGIAVDPVNGYVYVTNSGSANVTVLNGTSNTHVGSVHVGTDPRGIAFDSANGYLYVVNYRSHNVTVVNGATDHVVTSLPTSTYPEDAAFDGANGDVYVTVSSSDNVTVIDGANDQVIALVAVGSGPEGVAYDPGNGHLFVVNSNSNNVTVVNGATNRDVAPVFQSATGNYMVFQEPAGPLTYTISAPSGYGVSKVAGTDQPNVTEAEISANATISVDFGLLEPVTFEESGLPNGTIWGIELQSALPYGGPSSRTIVSSLVGQDAYLGPSAVSGTMGVGSAPVAIVLDPETESVYVADSGSSVLSILNGSSGQVIGSIPVSGQPVGMTFDGANGYLFVVSSGSVHRLTVIEAAIGTVLKTVHLSSAPESIAFDSANGFLYLTLASGVEVVNATSDATVGTIAAGTGPSGVLFDPTNGLVYVANSGSNNVTVINGTSDSAVGAIPTGSDPRSILLDSASGDLYVANSNASNLTVISPSSGHAIASVSVGSQPFDATYDSANGYLYVANNGSDNVSVVNPATNLAIGAIPAGTAPQAALFVGGNNLIYVANSGSNDVSVINGSATAGGVALHFVGVKGAWKYSLTTKPVTYAAQPSHGSLGVSVRPVEKVIKFKPVGETVIFHRTGARVPGTWGINLTGPESLALSGPGASLKVLLVNGTYDFTAWNFSNVHPDPTSGTFTVVASHTPLTITIRYTDPPPAGPRESSVMPAELSGSPATGAPILGPSRPDR